MDKTKDIPIRRLVHGQ